MAGWAKKIVGLAVAPILLTLSWPYLAINMSSLTGLQRCIRDSVFPASLSACHAHEYTTQIVSLEPLVIYIHNFLSDADIAALLDLGQDSFKPSVVTRYGRTAPDAQRTSHSAFLPTDDEAVRCVLDRARRFSGALLQQEEDAVRGGGNGMGAPQLVRYTDGQKFNLHYDWYPVPQWTKKAVAADGAEEARGARSWNRVASFFAILEDECEEGETWFPHVEPVTEAKEGDPWRRHQDGGVAFKPIQGNSLFWVNLHANGTGDPRVRHAGLPVGSGRKTAMNIWPRRYFN